MGTPNSLWYGPPPAYPQFDQVFSGYPMPGGHGAPGGSYMGPMPGSGSGAGSGSPSGFYPTPIPTTYGYPPGYGYPPAYGYPPMYGYPVPFGDGVQNAYYQVPAYWYGR